MSSRFLMNSYKSFYFLPSYSKEMTMKGYFSCRNRALISRSYSAPHHHIKALSLRQSTSYTIYMFLSESIQDDRCCRHRMILTLPIGLTPKTRVQFKSFFKEVHFIRRSMLPATFSSSSYYYSLFFFFELNVIVFYSTLILLGNRVSCQRSFEQNK